MYRFPFSVGTDYHVNSGMAVFSLFNFDMLGVAPAKGIAVVTQIVGSLLLKSGIVYFVKDSLCDCIYFHFPLPLPFAIFAAPVQGAVIQLVLQLFLRSDAVNLSVL